MMSEKIKGLTTAQARESRQRHGENLVTPPARESVWKLLLEKFKDPIIEILLVAALLSLLIAATSGQYIETAGIVAAILLATCVGFFFEWDAGKKFDLLNRVNDDVPVKVYRDGQVHQIPRREVVVGDVVVLAQGDEIPADGQLTEAVSLQVNESTLTGEPVVDKTTDRAGFEADATYPSDRVLRGTTVVDGRGEMEVTAVGDATEFGKVARQSSVKSQEKTPLNRQLEGLAGFISVVGFAFALLIFVLLFVRDIFLGGHRFATLQTVSLWVVVGAFLVLGVKLWTKIAYDLAALFRKGVEQPRWLRRSKWWGWALAAGGVVAVFIGVEYALGIDPTDADNWVPVSVLAEILGYLMVAVTLIVVVVPEGLPMSVTLSLALSMRRMLRSNNLVRKMHACETMGAVTVICTDKTGTLTQNRMQVRQADFYGLPEEKDPGADTTLPDRIKVGIAVNSTAFLETGPQGEVSVIGNPTEGALLLWLADRKCDYRRLRESVEVVSQLTFSTERKYMATLVRESSGRHVLYVKGAPEIVLGKSSSLAVSADRTEPLAGHQDRIRASLTAYQNQAMRTLGLACREVEESELGASIEQLAASSLVFLGIVAISDPVRPDVGQAIGQCLHAGVAVKIVTGDTPATAREIARQIGLWDPQTDTQEALITGPEFEALSDEVALERVARLKIMARARPMDKQRLVRLLQQRGEVVAVTGDGTNDAPALNFAHVGLSMGSGTSVAKEASDITILDDSFTSISSALMWGRSLYRNIQRFIVFQLTINLVALLVVFLGSALGGEAPLSVTQMLWVNLIMDTLAAGALASLPPEAGVMNDRPRDASAFIITREMKRAILTTGAISAAALLAVLGWFYHTGGRLSPTELSMFFTLFVMMQVWNMLNVRAFASGHSAFYRLGGSGAFLAVVLTIVVAQVLIVSFGGQAFNVVPLTAVQWLTVAGASSLVLWIGEIVRLCARFAARSRKAE